MAIEYVSDKTKTPLYSLPENPREQKDYKSSLSKNKEDFLAAISSFQEFIRVKYINSQINDEKIRDKAIDDLFDIAYASTFGFCKINLQNIENLFLERSFKSLADMLEETVDNINSNKKIEKYLEGRTTKEVLSERIKTANNMLEF